MVSFWPDSIWTPEFTDLAITSPSPHRYLDGMTVAGAVRGAHPERADRDVRRRHRAAPSGVARPGRAHRRPPVREVASSSAWAVVRSRTRCRTVSSSRSRSAGSRSRCGSSGSCGRARGRSTSGVSSSSSSTLHGSTPSPTRAGCHHLDRRERAAADVGGSRDGTPTAGGRPTSGRPRTTRRSSRCSTPPPIAPVVTPTRSCPRSSSRASSGVTTMQLAEILEAPLVKAFALQIPANGDACPRVRAPTR